MVFFGTSMLGLPQDQVRHQVRLVQRVLMDPRNRLFGRVHVFWGMKPWPRRFDQTNAST